MIVLILCRFLHVAPEILKKNLGANNSLNVRSYCLAVSKIRSNAKIYSDFLNPGANSMFVKRGLGYKIKCVTLEDIFVSEKINVSSFPIHEYWLDIGRMSDFEQAQSEYYRVFDEE